MESQKFKQERLVVMGEKQTIDLSKVNDPEYMPSLKEQLIKALEKSPRAYLSQSVAKNIFEYDLWPILEASINNGNLLLVRNTGLQKPVGEAIEEWLKTVLWFCQRIRADEATISRRKAIDLIYQFEREAQKALTDAQRVREAQEAAQGPKA